MVSTSLSSPPAKVWSQRVRQPIFLASLVSVGLHGIIFAAMPFLSRANDQPGEPESVGVVALSPQDMERLPDFARNDLLNPDNFGSSEVSPSGLSPLPVPGEVPLGDVTEDFDFSDPLAAGSLLGPPLDMLPPMPINEGFDNSGVIGDSSFFVNPTPLPPTNSGTSATYVIPPLETGTETPINLPDAPALPEIDGFEEIAEPFVDTDPMAPLTQFEDEQPVEPNSQTIAANPFPTEPTTPFPLPVEPTEASDVDSDLNDSQFQPDDTTPDPNNDVAINSETQVSESSPDDNLEEAVPEPPVVPVQDPLTAEVIAMREAKAEQLRRYASDGSSSERDGEAIAGRQEALVAGITDFNIAQDSNPPAFALPEDFPRCDRDFHEGTIGALVPPEGGTPTQVDMLDSTGIAALNQIALDAVRAKSYPPTAVPEAVEGETAEGEAAEGEVTEEVTAQSQFAAPTLYYVSVFFSNDRVETCTGP